MISPSSDEGGFGSSAGSGGSSGVPPTSRTPDIHQHHSPAGSVGSDKAVSPRNSASPPIPSKSTPPRSTGSPVAPLERISPLPQPITIPTSKPQPGSTETSPSQSTPTAKQSKDAQIARIAELFRSCVASCAPNRGNSYTHLHALANELAARFWLQLNIYSTGNSYLIQSLRAYTRWGANRKRQLMLKEFPGLGKIKMPRGNAAPSGTSPGGAHHHRAAAGNAGQQSTPASAASAAANTAIHNHLHYGSTNPQGALDATSRAGHSQETGGAADHGGLSALAHMHQTRRGVRDRSEGGRTHTLGFGGSSSGVKRSSSHRAGDRSAALEQSLSIMHGDKWHGW